MMSLRIVFNLTHIVYPDAMPHYATFHLGIVSVQGSQLCKVIRIPLTPVLLNPDMYTLDNSVDPDQLTSDEAIKIRICIFFRAVSESTILIEMA